MLTTASLEILRTSHWIVRHSVEAAIPGYLVIASTHPTTTFVELPPPAGEELGPLLHRMSAAVESLIKPERVYVCLFNESYSPIHFHIFPRMDWMKRFTPHPDDPSKLADGGIIFSAARKAMSDPAEIAATEPRILEAVEAIRRLVGTGISVKS